MKINKENTGNPNGHSINCACTECTGDDAYIARLRGQVGKNSSYMTENLKRFAARPGVYGQAYVNTADPIVPIAVTKPAATVAPTSGGNEWLGLFKDLGLEALGTLMDKQKSGTLTDPTLNKIGALGNQIADAGVNAGVQQANTTVGENVIKFSPWIIGGVVLALGTIIYLVAKKS